METLLDLIKEFPEEIIRSANGRAGTTPSPKNHRNHIMLISYIETEDWDAVSELIQSKEYHKPLDGVVICCQSYNPSMKFEDHIRMCNAFDSGNLV